MSELIQLILLNNNVFVWSAKDWLKLRRDHRIVGELIGCLPKLPRQDIMAGLPLLLLPEEVSLLVEKGIACVGRYKGTSEPPSESLRQVFEEYREILYKEQEECLRDHRKKQIMTMMDKIVEGKRRKMLGIETSKKKTKKPLEAKTQEALKNVEIDTTQLLKEEMAKLPKLDKNDAFVQTHTACPWTGKSDFEIIEWNSAATPHKDLKYRTYKDLWEQGYYITSGEKFGGDFLVYPGDPIMFHSQFIVQCICRNDEMSVVELIRQCRVGCHVRKTQVYAMFSQCKETIKYQSFQWAESNVLENG